jgi:hypothetical protein
MTPKTKVKKRRSATSDAEFRAALKRIDAHIKSTDASLRKSRMIEKKMAPDVEALKRMVADE